MVLGKHVKPANKVMRMRLPHKKQIKKLKDGFLTNLLPNYKIKKNIN
jgi:hypothetical protein